MGMMKAMLMRHMDERQELEEQKEVAASVGDYNRLQRLEREHDALLVRQEEETERLNTFLSQIVENSR